MAFFDFLKKKESLEDLLRQASHNPSVRSEFYNRLLSDDLIVITDNQNSTNGKRMMQTAEKLKLLPLNDQSIAVFTSKERIFDKGIIKQQVNTLAIKGRDLFENTSGAKFTLNPFSDYGKVLLAEEIQRILRGGSHEDQTKTITYTKETPVQIGLPAKHPTMAVEMMIKIFESKQEVKSAYVGWIFEPDSGVAPHYIFAFETTGDFHKLTAELGPIIHSLIAPETFFDMYPISRENTGVNSFFKSITPFFKR